DNLHRLARAVRDSLRVLVRLVALLDLLELRQLLAVGLAQTQGVPEGDPQVLDHEVAPLLLGGILKVSESNVSHVVLLLVCGLHADVSPLPPSTSANWGEGESGLGLLALAAAARGHERGHRVGPGVATHNERRDLERQRREVLRVVNLRVLATQERSPLGEDGEGAGLRAVVVRDERTLGGSRGCRHAEEAATVQRLHVVAVVQLQRVLSELLKVDREVLRTGSDTSAKVRVLERAQDRDLATLRRELD